MARGRHLAGLAPHGLRLLVPEGEPRHRLPVVDGPGPLGGPRADDVLLLAVKTQDTVAALETRADVPVAGGGTAARRLPLVSLQNGVESGRLALRRFRHVYGVCVWLPSAFVEPGVVSAAGSPLTGILHLGRLPHGTDDTERRIAAGLADARFEVPVVPDVARQQYANLLGNLGSAVEAVSGRLADEAGQALYARGGTARGTRRQGDPPAAGQRPARRLLLLAVPGPRHRHHRDGLSQRRDPPARPAARRTHPAERTANCSSASRAASPASTGPPARCRSRSWCAGRTRRSGDRNKSIGPRRREANGPGSGANGRLALRS